MFFEPVEKERGDYLGSQFKGDGGMSRSLVPLFLSSS